MTGRAAPVVEVLYVAGCPSHRGTLELIERVRAELGVAIDLRPRLIGDPAEAELARFPGSPTVRVNGLDIEPGPEEHDTVGFGCRLYHGEGGQPAAERIRRSLQAAAGRG